MGVVIVECLPYGCIDDGCVRMNATIGYSYYVHLSRQRLKSHPYPDQAKNVPSGRSSSDLLMLLPAYSDCIIVSLYHCIIVSLYARQWQDQPGVVEE